TRPLRLSKANRKEIDTAYQQMNKQHMWRLSSGRLVEEELYKLGKKLKFEHAVHSFILDVDDKLILEHFSETELYEIDRAAGPQVPELSDCITELLHGFVDKTSLKEIRETIMDKIVGRNYDNENHHCYDYVINALNSLIREIQTGSVKGAKLEAWFNYYILNEISDQAFGNINVVSVVRGESTNLAAASRKNAKRKSGELRKVCFRTGAGVWSDEQGTEFLKKTELGLLKVLKDLLIMLMKKVDWNTEKCVKMQTVGIIHAGYVYRIRRGELMEVPDNLDDFSSVLKILEFVLNLK
ncbi:165_t:CDS:2, partial [Acaulospora colombiana]